jgi:solute carrier family 12 (potassium/chloride transporter), member 4/6
MFMISWAFSVVSLALASLIYYYVSLKGKAGDWGDGFKSAYFQLALRSLRSLGGMIIYFMKNKQSSAEVQLYKWHVI